MAFSQYGTIQYNESAYNNAENLILRESIATSEAKTLDQTTVLSDFVFGLENLGQTQSNNFSETIRLSDWVKIEKPTSPWSN